MNNDYGVDTDQLRTMAAGAAQVADDFGSTRVSHPTSLGHEGIEEAVSYFTEKWGSGLQTRIDEMTEFADKLKNTARIFDDGQNAAQREMDSLIWDQ